MKADESVIINPDAFVLELRDKGKKTKLPLEAHRPHTRAKKRIMLCADCFAAVHRCTDDSCPCSCKRN